MENQGDIDMSIVRLCWQVFLPDPQGKFTRALKPVMSELIYDKSKWQVVVVLRLISDWTCGTQLIADWVNCCVYRDGQ